MSSNNVSYLIHCSVHNKSYLVKENFFSLYGYIFIVILLCYASSFTLVFQWEKH